MANRVELLVCATLLVLVTSCRDRSQREEPYANPGAEFQESDLVGVWNRDDYGGQDRITLRADGTFEQVYEGRDAGSRFETGWNKWSIEHLTDGRVYLRLPGARYYRLGSCDEPGRYYDPTTRVPIEADKGLPVAVLMADTGQLVFVLPLQTPDEGWIYGDTGKAIDAYRRAKSQ